MENEKLITLPITGMTCANCVAVGEVDFYIRRMGDVQDANRLEKVISVVNDNPRKY